QISGNFGRVSRQPRAASVDAPSSDARATDLVCTTPSNSAHPSEPDQTGSYPPADSEPADQDMVAPSSFDRYQVVSVLGKGGFGVVYRGYDPELHRDVAIKVPLRSRKASSAKTEAYLAEARVVAQLDHPGIVPVYDARCTGDGQCFVVSKLVAGSDLAKWMEGRPRDARCAAGIVAQVADALHHAHQKTL